MLSGDAVVAGLALSHTLQKQVEWGKLLLHITLLCECVFVLVLHVP